MRSLKGIGATHLRRTGEETLPAANSSVSSWPGRVGPVPLSYHLFMGLLNVTERYFVTGTDTEVGKTVASAALLQAARLLGKTTAGYSP